ncbi:DUF2933 domain-containing protein [Micromonospora chersina]|uniref:DUF2933 domain-containing protein n=1 Tax=Micromonospora chersina TaxID=47854 RepID=UPI003411C13D
MRRHLPLYAIALAILIVGALALGVPARSVGFGLLALACPLMMLFMHGGHGSHSGHGEQPPSGGPTSAAR